MKWVQILFSGMMVFSLLSCSSEDGSSPMSTGVPGSGGPINSPTITGLALPSSPNHAVIRNGEVFWSDSDPYIRLKKASVTGGGITPLALVYSNAIQIIKRGDLLYWSESFRVGRQFPDGLVQIVVEGSACSNGESFGTNIVVDDTHLYRLAGSPPPGGTSSCAIARTDLSNGTTVTFVDNPTGPMYSLIADSTHIYWSERSSDGTSDAYVIKKASKATGSIQTLASGLKGFAGNLSIAGSFLVFGEASGIGTAHLLKVPLAGGSLITLTVPSSHAETDGLRGLVVDSSNAYWIGDMTVQSVSLNGGTPRVLITGNNQTVAIAANATDLYWIEHVCCAGDFPSRIHKVSKGGGASILVTEGIYDARTLTLDSTTIYLAEGGVHFVGRIAQAPIAGGPPTTVLSGIGRGASASFIVGDAGIFTVDGEVLKRVPLDGSLLVEKVYWKLGSNFPWGLVTHDRSIYFIAPDNTGNNALFKIPVDGGAPDALASAPGRVSGPLAVGSGMVFWVSQPFVIGPGSIMRTSILGGPSVPLASGLTSFVSQMLVDSEALYWAELGSGAIRKVALTGGPVITLRPGSANMGSLRIAQDEGFIYWTDEWGVGKVSKAGGQLFFYESGYDIRIAIGVDDTSVYWVTQYALMRATPK